MAFAVVAFATPTLAQEQASPLTPEQETKLLDLVAALEEPPQTEMKAVLTPPMTFYTVQLVPAEKERIDALTQRAKELGLSGYVVINTDEDRWSADVACGTFKGSHYGGDWSHPEGTPPSECPHEDGTSHSGTIRARGSVHLAFSKDKVAVFSAIWGFTCTYSGSEAGVERCETEIEQFGGFYGAMFSERYGFSTNDNSVDPWNNAWIYAGVTLVIAGTGFVFFRRKSKE